MRVRRIGHALVRLSRRAIDHPRDIHNLTDRDVESPRRILDITNLRFGSVSGDYGCYRLEYHIEAEYPVTLEIALTDRAVCGFKDRSIGGIPPEHVASIHIRKRDDGLVAIGVGDRIRTPCRTCIQIRYVDDRTVARGTVRVQDVPEDLKSGQVLIGKVLTARVDCADSCGAQHHQSEQQIPRFHTN